VQRVTVGDRTPVSSAGRQTLEQLPDTVVSVMLVTPLWGRNGGVATHVQTSAEALARHGFEVHVLTAQINSGDPPPGVTLHHRPQLLERGASPQSRLGDFTSPSPSVIHIHQRDDPEMVGLLRRSAPVVISAHGYPGCSSGVHYFSPGHECTRAHGPGCVPNLLVRGCAHTRYPRTLPAKYMNVSRGLAALRQADLAVSYSSTVDRHLAVNGLTRRAIVPCFPTIPTSSAEPVTRRVVFAGRVEQPKGVAVLIQAAREVEGEFVICGGGRQLEAMRTLAARLGVEARIRFTGWLEPDALADELAAASVVVVPSLWPEPFGLVGIEALAAGRPVIASATGGILDWLEDGVGLRVRPGEVSELVRALDQLLSNPERGRAMGATGRRLVAERFSPERHVEALTDAYRRARHGWLAEHGR
jgi:glycosyltransferase involved in cell wall biosynthesis